MSHQVANDGEMSTDTKQYISELNAEYYKSMVKAKELGSSELNTSSKFDKKLNEGLITERMVKGWLKKKK